MKIFLSLLLLVLSGLPYSECGLNADCLKCLEAPGADPGDCTGLCGDSTRGSTRMNAECFECLEAPGADPGDCVTPCDTSTTSSGSSTKTECFECMEAPGADPGDCDGVCDFDSAFDSTSAAPFHNVAFPAGGALLALAVTIFV